MSNLLLNYCLLLDAKKTTQQHDSGIMSGIFSLRNEGADEFSEGVMRCTHCKALFEGTVITLDNFVMMI